jgi:membrane protein implicated in regulation of membrane protease activity
MTSQDPSTRRSAPVEDSNGGLAMFLIFTAAALTATGAVALLAVVGTFWMLGVAFAVHVAMTTVVVLTILHVAGASRPIADRDRPSPVEDRRLPHTPPATMTAL